MNYYRVLQVDPGANALVIQAAYRVLARIFHPDVDGDDVEMKQINRAWEMLGDARRAAYDRELAGRHQSGDGCRPVHSAGQDARAASHVSPFRSPTTTPARRRASRSGRSCASAATTAGRSARWVKVDRPFLEWLRTRARGRQ